MANIQNICDSIDSLKKLVLINNCFSVRMQQTIMAELCCLSKLSMPMDGFGRVSSVVAPHSSLEIFDNGLDVSPLSDNLQTRGIILCLGYPSLDADGNPMEDAYKDATLHIYDKAGNPFAMPICKTFILLGNPVISDTSKILNRMVLENTGNFTLSVEGLLLLVNKDGMTLPQGLATCC